jgi:hypothetical protein
MDFVVVGLLTTAAIVVAVVYAMRPQKVLPLDELLSRLTSISADATLTAAQKRHLAEIAYQGFEDCIVSVIGSVQDVFPNGAVVMRTVSHELPLVGIELNNVKPGELRGFMKGNAVTLRVRLPGWKNFSDVVGLPAGFRDARLFYGGRWHGVKSTYRVRDPSEPKTGTFPALPMGETKNPRTGEFKRTP